MKKRIKNNKQNQTKEKTLTNTRNNNPKTQQSERNRTASHTFCDERTKLFIAKWNEVKWKESINPVADSKIKLLFCDIYNYVVCFIERKRKRRTTKIGWHTQSHHRSGEKVAYRRSKFVATINGFFIVMVLSFAWSSLTHAPGTASRRRSHEKKLQGNEDFFFFVLFFLLFAISSLLPERETKRQMHGKWAQAKQRKAKKKWINEEKKITECIFSSCLFEGKNSKWNRRATLTDASNIMRKVLLCILSFRRFAFFTPSDSWPVAPACLPVGSLLLVRLLFVSSRF